MQNIGVSHFRNQLIFFNFESLNMKDFLIISIPVTPFSSIRSSHLIFKLYLYDCVILNNYDRPPSSYLTCLYVGHANGA